jgi:hypothetical protein
LERQKLSIKKLKNLFFGDTKTEKSKNILPETESDKDKGEGEGGGEGGGGGEASGNGIEYEDSKKKKVKKKKKGHGKNGASAYVGAEEIYISHKFFCLSPFFLSPFLPVFLLTYISSRYKIFSYVRLVLIDQLIPFIIVKSVSTDIELRGHTISRTISRQRKSGKLIPNLEKFQRVKIVK